MSGPRWTVDEDDMVVYPDPDIGELYAAACSRRMGRQVLAPEANNALVQAVRDADKIAKARQLARDFANSRIGEGEPYIAALLGLLTEDTK